MLPFGRFKKVVLSILIVSGVVRGNFLNFSLTFFLIYPYLKLEKMGERGQEEA